MSRYTPVAEIARGYFGLLNPQRRDVVVLNAYFDDSGTHSTSKVVALAGFMASVDEWSKFEPEWANVLAREGLRSFHAADFKSGYGQCEGWPLARREAVRADFRNVIASRDVIGIGAVVRADDWHAFASDSIKSRYISQIYLVFEHCIQQALRWAEARTVQETGVKEPVAFFFDSFNRDAAVCLDIGKAYEHKWRRSDWYENTTFSDMARTLPLQAADMLAHETYAMEVQRIKSGGETALTPHLRAMLEDIRIYGQMYDREGFSALARQISQG